MQPTVYWTPLPVAGRLAIMARPRGDDWLDDEMHALAMLRVDTVVSLLTPNEVAELGLAQEAQACENHSLHFTPFPIPDRQTPDSFRETMALIRGLTKQLQESETIVIHCRMGVGRSALMAALILADLGSSTKEAFAALAQARGCPVPDTPEQERWVERCRQWRDVVAP